MAYNLLLRRTIFGQCMGSVPIRIPLTIDFGMPTGFDVLTTRSMIVHVCRWTGGT